MGQRKRIGLIIGGICFAVFAVIAGMFLLGNWQTKKPSLTSVGEFREVQVLSERGNRTLSLPLFEVGHLNGPFGFRETEQPEKRLESWQELQVLVEEWPIAVANSNSQNIQGGSVTISLAYVELTSPDLIRLTAGYDVFDTITYADVFGEDSPDDFLGLIARDLVIEYYNETDEEIWIEPVMSLEYFDGRHWREVPRPSGIVLTVAGLDSHQSRILSLGLVNYPILNQFPTDYDFRFRLRGRVIQEWDVSYTNVSVEFYLRFR